MNVFCLGIARQDEIVKGIASGVGNAVYYVGAKTGRDGIHGATMASAEFDEKSAEKRPAVQVGDPFTEKLLLEACLEVMATDACVHLGLKIAELGAGVQRGNGGIVPVRDLAEEDVRGGHETGRPASAEGALENPRDTAYHERQDAPVPQQC